MSQRIPRLTIAALAVAACAALGAGAATASASTLYVSNSAPPVVGGKSCAQPNYSAIQAAITAGGAGAVIKICPGTYTEQLEITNSVTLTAASGVGTATIAMPQAPAYSGTSCDILAHPEQIDEISICTSGTVTINNLNVQALFPNATCAGELYGIFVGEGGTLKATGDTVDGASTTLPALKGCQTGVAIEIGNKTPAEVGHAVLKNLTIYGYQKNGPTVKSPGSTMTITGSTITGEGPSPDIAQNGIEVAYGAKGVVNTSSISGNECNVPVCAVNNEEQASGVLFYQSASGSNVTSSTITNNDIGAYYGSGSATVPAMPAFTLSKDGLTNNRYEGVVLEEGKASLKNDVINGTGKVGIDLVQLASQLSALNSSATSTKVEGQETAIKVESDKSALDIPGKFTFATGTLSGNGTILVNESNNFEVIF